MAALICNGTHDPDIIIIFLLANVDVTYGLLAFLLDVCEIHAFYFFFICLIIIISFNQIVYAYYTSLLAQFLN